MATFLNYESFVDLLLARGTDVNSREYYYGTALQAAARCGLVALIKKLLKAGAEVNATGGWWYMAVPASLVDGHERSIFCLLEHGADMHLEPDEALAHCYHLRTIPGTSVTHFA